MKRIICWIFGHRYHVVQVFSSDSRRVCCLCCDGEWAMNDRVRALVPWSDEFERFYRESGHLIKESANV